VRAARICPDKDMSVGRSGESNFTPLPLRRTDRSGICDRGAFLFLESSRRPQMKAMRRIVRFGFPFRALPAVPLCPGNRLHPRPQYGLPALTSLGYYVTLGTVRMRSCLPIRSAMTQRPSRCCR